MASPANVEKLWDDAKVAFDSYKFDLAIELIDTYTTNARHNKNNDAQCAELRSRAVHAVDMMDNVEEVTILDSIKCTKGEMLDFIYVPRESGTLKMLDSGGVRFTTGRGDKNIVAENENGQFDLFLKYSDGEKRKLPEIVNSKTNENYPFELTDGTTLYFASDGHSTIGGYDLFMTRYNNETQTYSEPMHIGMPFNSIYNDYMMVIDEMSNVGWFATDRYQNDDTVVIYKFNVTEQKKLLAQELDNETKIATAQMKRYKMGYVGPKDADEVVSAHVEIETFSFVVNDTLIYTSEKQFKDSLSLVKFHKIKELQKAINLQSIILEGKKREFYTSDNQVDRALLRKEILEDEEFIVESRKQISELTKEIRKLEYLKL